MHWHAYINTARTIIESYDGSIPLAGFLRQFFKAHKKHGSKDRKFIAQLCYPFYRLGNAFYNETIEDRILISNFLCSREKNDMLEILQPEWAERIEAGLFEKLEYLQAPEEWLHIFPFASSLSPQIDFKDFTVSFCVQPDLHIRLRPGKEKAVIQKLETAGIVVREKMNHTLVLPNASQLETVLALDEEAVIQDLNSQQVLKGYEALVNNDQAISAWDCCAASGGKSILLIDHYPQARLTVSDLRPSIMHNLQSRFQRAGIKEYKHFVTDISAAGFKNEEVYDLVLCDAPCTGSGTWSRTPEQLYFFRQEKIGHYATLQKRIAVNAASSVKKGGHFLYITCSVFEKENEEVVMHIQENTGLKFLSMHYHKGYHIKADTLFTALFIGL